MVNPKSLKNIIPPVKGEVRNPKGKAKGTLSFTTLLKRMLKSKVDIKDSSGNILRVSKKRVILLKWMEKAMTGDVKAIEGVIDRIEGKPKTIGEMTIKGGLSSMSEQELEDIVKKHNIDDKPSKKKLGINKTEVT